MTEKPKTRAQLEVRIAELEAAKKEHDDIRDNLRRELAAAQQREKETRAQFNDLKERLANAGAETERMRGYIARVQEDDVVREELVTTGDPAGEQHLVPKRKPISFEPRVPYSSAGMDTAGGYRERQPPRHWVTY